MMAPLFVLSFHISGLVSPKLSPQEESPELYEILTSQAVQGQWYRENPIMGSQLQLHWDQSLSDFYNRWVMVFWVSGSSGVPRGKGQTAQGNFRGAPAFRAIPDHDCGFGNDAL